ncbi:phage tail protein, partial [Escherichia coli]|uniref:phage tail protein n=1 Tax=Escherichia coli TaxID=562 RepID=UPI00201A8DBE
MKTFRWKVKPDMEVNSQPSVREVRFGDGYSQRMAAGLNASLLYSSGAADEEKGVGLGGRGIIKKKKKVDDGQ